MRIAVADVLGWLSAGMSDAQILADCPEPTEEDIREATLRSEPELAALPAASRRLASGSPGQVMKPFEADSDRLCLEVY